MNFASAKNPNKESRDMPFPNIDDLLQDLEKFDAAPASYTIREATTLRERIYHALWYHDKKIRPLDIVAESRLRRMLARIKSLGKWLSA